MAESKIVRDQREWCGVWSDVNCFQKFFGGDYRDRASAAAWVMSAVRASVLGTFVAYELDAQHS
jgi:hypothetical protein